MQEQCMDSNGSQGLEWNMRMGNGLVEQVGVRRKLDGRTERTTRIPVTGHHGNASESTDILTELLLRALLRSVLVHGHPRRRCRLESLRDMH